MQIHHFVHFVYVPVVLLQFTIVILVAYLQGGTSLEKVILLFTGETVNESAASALPEVLLLVNFCWLAALSHWAPPKIVHLINSLIN